jgi:hypothetical protein
MKDYKPVIRRTFSQERFEILIKKQKSGEAIFRDLTELDEIVNRVPDIRLTILEEMENDGKNNIEKQENEIIIQQVAMNQNLFEKIKIMIGKLLHISALSLKLA